MNKSLLLGGLLTTVAHAGIGDTDALRNLFPADYPFQSLEKPPVYKTLLAKFVKEFGRPDTFINNMGSPSLFDRAVSFQQANYNDVTWINDKGQRSFGDAAGYGIREAAVSYFPVKEFESDIQDIGSRFTHVVIGDTAEEQRLMVSAIPNASEYSWMKQAREDGAYNYNLRPFNSSPYLHGYMKVGHFAGQSLATVSGRWYYDLRHSKDHMSFETIFNMQHNYGFQVGASFDPFNFNASDTTSCSMRLQHFGQNGIFKSWSIGVVQNSQTTLVAQLGWFW